MIPQHLDMMRILPEIVLSVFAILIMVLEPFVGAAHKKTAGLDGLLGIARRGRCRRPPFALPLAGYGTGIWRIGCCRRL